MFIFALLSSLGQCLSCFLHHVPVFLCGPFLVVRDERDFGMNNLPMRETREHGLSLSLWCHPDSMPFVITDGTQNKNKITDIFICVKIPSQQSTPRVTLFFPILTRTSSHRPHLRFLNMTANKVSVGDTIDLCGLYTTEEYEIGFTHKFMLDGPVKVIPRPGSFEDLPVARRFAQTVMFG